MTRRVYWIYPLRALSRGGIRVLLAVVGIAVGVMALVTLQIVGSSLTSALVGSAVQDTGGDVVIDSTVTPLSGTDLLYLSQLRTSGQISGYTAFSVHGAEGMTSAGTRISYIDLLVVDPASFPLDGGATFVSPADGSVGSLVQGTSVIISNSLLSVPGMHLGTELGVTSDDGRTLTVRVGGVIADTPPIRYINNPPFMLLSESTYAAVDSSSNTPVTFSNVSMDVPGHDPARAGQLEASLQRHFPLTVIQTAQQEQAQFESQAAFLRSFLQAAALLALLISGVSIGQTLLVLLHRRRLEIAVLKTLGYRRRDLYILFGAEVGLLGFGGSVLGAIVGVGVSQIFALFFQQFLQVPLSPAPDLRTIGIGMVAGVGTALAFGWLPVLQASRLRPVAVLRGQDEAARPGWLSAGLALCPMVLLFLVLTQVLVGSVPATLLLVSLGTAVLLLLAASFSGLTAAVGLIPAAGFAPRRLRVTIRMGMRNVARRRGRSVLVAGGVFVSIFTIGLLLAIGLGLQQQLSGALAEPSQYDAFMLVPSSSKAATDQEVSLLTGVQQELVTEVVSVRPNVLQHVPVTSLVERSAPGQRHTVYYALARLTRVDGYALAGGQSQSLQGLQIAAGRTLGAADAGTASVLLPAEVSQSPLFLKVGGQITVYDPETLQSATLTVAGFYRHSLLSDPEYGSGAILADDSVVASLSNGRPSYQYALRLDPPLVDATLQKIQQLIPGVQVDSLVDDVASGTLLNRLAPPVIAVAGLTLLASVVSIANLVALALLEQRRDLAILSGLGYTGRRLNGLVLIEQGINAGIGSATAAVAVVLVAAPAVRAIYGPSLPYRTLGTVPLVIGVALACILLCLLVASLVAGSATRSRPASVLRYE